MQDRFLISQLFIYPIKSCGGISLLSSDVDTRGLLHDRRWMLVDKNNQFISQRDFSKLACVKSMITHDHLHVSFENEKMDIPFLKNTTAQVLEQVIVWDDRSEGIVYENIINEWFSDILKMHCKLVYMPDETNRIVDQKYAPGHFITSYSDGYPILLLSQVTIDYLNQKSSIPIDILRFRPNIVFSGGTPHCEDAVKKVSVQACVMEGVKLCARCNVPNIDQNTGIVSNEPTASLAKYRLFDKKILVGQNLIVHKTGSISVGDELCLLN